MSDNPFTRRRETHKIGRGGRKSETRLAKTLGGTTTAASGAMTGFKGDIQRGEFLIEAKSTKNDSLGVKFEWLAKINQEARQAKNKRPALTISFTTEAGQALPNGDWICMRMSDFIELTEGRE